jgi:hypothetical protein
MKPNMRMQWTRDGVTVPFGALLTRARVYEEGKWDWEKK